MSRSTIVPLLAACTLFAAGCGNTDPNSAQSQDEVRTKKCHSNSDCPSLSFCDTEAAASCSSKGVCRPRGVNLLCANNQPPVCGCDGNTYNGSCMAHKAGTSVASSGACKVPCTDNSGCGDLEYCAKTEGDCGGDGFCQPRGITLFCIELYKPVCGCDGKTYGNSCFAQKAGATLDHDGACVCNFQDASIDGDTLAEQSWVDDSQTFFYQFTGNGTAVNDSGTVSVTISPPCLRSTPRCAIATRFKTGAFYTYGSTVEIDYDNGDVAYFDAQQDCNNAWQLVGDDFGGTHTLTVSTITP
jgi:hypothetical protein